MQYVEISHKNYLKFVDDYKANLETKINTQLKKNFVQELSKTGYYAARIKIEVESPQSYLKESLSKDEQIALENKIITEISDSMNYDSIIKKGVAADSAYFICSERKNAADFFTSFVISSTEAAFCPKAIPPSLTFGQEILISSISTG